MLLKIDVREELNKQWSDFLIDLRNEVGRFEKQTKTQYIQSALEITLRRIEAGIISISEHEISSYLFIELNKQVDAQLDEPVFSRRLIQYAVPAQYKDQEKRNYFGDEIISSNWTTITDDGVHKIEVDQFQNYRINGVEFTPKQKTRYESDPETGIVRDTTTEVVKDDYTKFTQIISRIGGVLDRIGSSLFDKYQNEDDRKKIQAVLGDVNEKNKELVTILAKLANNKNLLDDRNVWGDWEKTMMRFLLQAGNTTAYLAREVGYCAKYGSIKIDRGEHVVDQIKPELVKFLTTCPNCDFQVAPFFNEKFQAYKLGKEFDIKLPL